MGLILSTNTNSSFEVEIVELLKEEKKICAYNNEMEDKFHIDFPLEFDTNYPPEDFTIYLFWKEEFATNDIFRIKTIESTIPNNEFNGYLGWVFPISALESNQHDFSKNEHFLPYSTNAAIKLLKSPNIKNLVRKVFTSGMNTTLSELFHENIQIFITYNSYTETYKRVNGLDFDIKDFLLDFHNNGFFYLNERHYNDYVDGKVQIYNYPIKNKFAITIKSISKHFKNDNFITELFSGLLNTQDHSLVRFHLLYQIIEIAIDKVLKHEFSTLLTGFEENNDVYSCKSKLNELTKENVRISKLLTNYIPGVSSFVMDNLKNSCTIFLDKLGLIKEEENLTLADSLYKVRNTLFHNYRIVEEKNAIYDITEINENFEKLCIQLTTRFTNSSE